MSYQWDDNCIQFNAVEIARDGGRTERKLVVHRVTHLTFWKCKHLLWLCLWIKYLTCENSRIHFVSMQIWTRMTSLTHFRFSLCQPGSKRQQFGRLTEMKMTAARERRIFDKHNKSCSLLLRRSRNFGWGCNFKMQIACIHAMWDANDEFVIKSGWRRARLQNGKVLVSENELAILCMYAHDTIKLNNYNFGGDIFHYIIKFQDGRCAEWRMSENVIPFSFLWILFFMMNVRVWVDVWHYMWI